MRRSSQQAGGALLAVLWLSAILAALAFSLSTTVRGETERTATQSESTRAYYLAIAGIERALLYMELGPALRSANGMPLYKPGTPRMTFEFPNGVVEVELVAEASKFDINGIPPADLTRLLGILGVPAERAQQIVGAIVDWRSAFAVNAIEPL